MMTCISVSRGSCSRAFDVHSLNIEQSNRKPDPPQVFGRMEFMISHDFNQTRSFLNEKYAKIGSGSLYLSVHARSGGFSAFSGTD